MDTMMMLMTPPPACAKPKRLRFGEGRSPYDGDTSPASLGRKDYFL
jgi:hypothetical protein